MLNVIRAKAGRTRLYSACVSSVLLGAAGAASAKDFSAGTVMDEMDEGERYVFVAGIVEGLAYARYKQDGGADDGMACIYDWFYEEDGTIKRIYAAFDKFREHTPGAVVGALIERRCDE